MLRTPLIVLLACAACDDVSPTSEADDGAAADAEPTDAEPRDAAPPPVDAPTLPDAPPPPPAVLRLNEVDCRDADGLEVANLGEAAVDLTGWRAGEHPLAGEVAPGELAWVATGRLVCGRPVALVGPDEAVHDETTPPLGVAAATWGRLPDGEGEWGPTAPTPGEPNAPLAETGGDLFDGEVRELALELGPGALGALYEAPTTEVDGVLVVGDESVPAKVVVAGRAGRFKGIEQKPSLVLRFEAPWRGLPSLELDGLALDPAVLTRRVAGEVLRAAGVPAPRVGFANVTVDGDPYGLYAVAERRDETFLGRRFVSTAHLFAGAGLDLVPNHVDHFDVEVGNSWRGDLAAVATLPDEGFFEASTDSVDWPAVARALAAEVWLGSADGYGPARQASYFHTDPLGRLTLLPGGLDLSLRAGVHTHAGAGRLLQRCLADAACPYFPALAEVARSLDREWSLGGLPEALRPHVAADPRTLYSPEMFDAEVARIEAFLGQRPGEMRALADCLDAGEPGACAPPGPMACDGGPCPDCEERTRAGRTYWFCRNRASWEVARGICQRLGADLVAVDSPGEARWLNVEARAVRDGDYWVGLSDQEIEGTFEWVDGRDRGRPSWGDGEPNDSGGEDCAHLRGDGRLNDAGCNGNLGVMCELPCDPEVEGDADGDGAGGCGVDCDDGDPELAPGLVDLCGDGVDQDCNGVADDGPDCACTAAWRGERAYLVCPQNANWDEARAACQAAGMDLAIVDDAAENAWLFDVAVRRARKRYWIGVSDLVDEGRYRWWDGSKPRFSAWSRGEPNDAGHREDCGHFWENRPEWNDIQCDVRHGTLCEEVDE